MYCTAPLSPRKGRLRSFRDHDDDDDDGDDRSSSADMSCTKGNTLLENICLELEAADFGL